MQHYSKKINFFNQKIRSAPHFFTLCHWGQALLAQPSPFYKLRLPHISFKIIVI